MQVNNLISYLKKPDLILIQPEIKSIVDEFPYCQTTQLMYAYQLNKNNSILFDKQLKTAATYCTDRKKLFEHLHQETKKKTPEIVEETTKEIIISEKLKEEKDLKKPLDELEKNYLSEAISAEILIESAENENIEKQKEEVKEDTLFDTNTTHTFSDWLKHFNGENTLETTKVQKKDINKIDLINKFIQEDPKIKPKKTAFYSPVNMARLSVVDNSSLVSETLALIHVEQGNYQEAIKTYEQLSLKNPEKKSYFASQIKILKQKIK